VLWNAAARRATGNLRFMWLLTIGAALTGIAWTRGDVLRSLPSVVIPWLLGTMVVHSVYTLALGQAYGRAGLNWAYTLARGLSVLVTALGAVVLFAEGQPPLAWLGCGLVGGGVILLAFAAGTDTEGRALGWTLLVALAIVAYSLIDSHAMTLASPLPYLTGLFVGASLLMTPFALRTPLPARWGVAPLSGAVSFVSYLLILEAYRLAPVGEVQALRQVAPVLALVIGWVALRERPTERALVATALVALGAALVARG
jgi:drug/metabolite transporter (DMT)-like permease